MGFFLEVGVDAGEGEQTVPDEEGEHWGKEGEDGVRVGGGEEGGEDSAGEEKGEGGEGHEECTEFSDAEDLDFGAANLAVRPGGGGDAVGGGPEGDGEVGEELCDAVGHGEAGGLLLRGDVKWRRGLGRGSRRTRG